MSATPLGLGPGTKVIPALRVSGRVARKLPAAWAVSFDLGGRVRATVGSRPVPVRSGWDHGAAGGHGEAVGANAGTLVFRGHGVVRNLVLSSTAYPASLLLHRLAELHARLRPGEFPIGADGGNRLHIGADDNWNSGFYEGALWRAAAFFPRPFRSWALAATLAHLGHEQRPVADVGFMYGQSSLLAWQALCPGTRRRALCAQLRHSVLSAADEQAALAAGVTKAGVVPSGASGRVAVTIVDNMMNVAILPWAGRQTGRAVYARVALRHARRTAALLVRPDGSTIQAVNFDRRTGRVLGKATHQGISEQSTWSRGQAWGVYGFAVDGLALRDRPLLRVGERLASYVELHLPADGVPRWDYDAPAGAPLDVSAGAITAAGAFHLASACQAMPGTCAEPPSHWRALGRRMLSAALGYVQRRRPLGYLGSQELNEHAHGCWCNGAELTFGLSYALEALRAARA